MRKQIQLLFAVLLTIGYLNELQAKSETFSTLDAGEVEGVTYVIDATKKVIDDLPGWKFGDGEPGISIDEAYRIARDQLKRTIDRSERLHHTTMNMREVSLGGKVRFVYSFSFVEVGSVSSTEQTFHEEWNTPNQIRIWVGTNGYVFGTKQGTHEEIIH